VHCRSSEVVFTASATEAIATVVRGSLATAGPDAEVIGTAVEHSAVRLSAGDVFRPIAVDVGGLIDPAHLAHKLDSGSAPVALVACQLGNHEMGAIQDVGAVASICAERGVRLLVDAAQAAPWHRIDFATLGATFLAISGPKLGAPPGTGALIVKRGARVPPFLVGGDQERGRRAGLENTPAIIGLAAACHQLSSSLGAEIESARRLTDRLRRGLVELDTVSVFGPVEPSDRLPHLVCCGIGGIEPQAVLLGLDRAGIAAHSGSACASEGLEPSPVLAAMGVDADRSLRLSVHAGSADDDIDAVLAALPPILESLRSLH
jgi:cysteine desulfurase